MHRLHSHARVISLSDFSKEQPRGVEESGDGDHFSSVLLSSGSMRASKSTMTGFDLSGGCHQMVLYPSDCFQRNPIRGKYQNRHCYLERQWQKCFHAGFIIDVG